MQHQEFEAGPDDGHTKLHAARWLPAPSIHSRTLLRLGVQASTRNGPLSHLRNSRGIDPRGVAAATTLGVAKLSLVWFLPPRLGPGGAVRLDDNINQRCPDYPGKPRQSRAESPALGPVSRGGE